VAQDLANLLCSVYGVFYLRANHAAGIALAGVCVSVCQCVCLSVCLSVLPKNWKKLLIRIWCNWCTHYTVKAVQVVEILIALHTALSPAMAWKLCGY